MRLLIALAAAFVAFSPSFAYAHMHLTGSMPEDGAVLNDAPTEIVLIFSEPARVTSLTLTSEEGDTALIDSPSEPVTEFKAPLPSLAPGDYSIGWRSAASDMHVMSGAINFTISGN